MRHTQQNQPLSVNLGSEEEPGPPLRLSKEEREELLEELTEEIEFEFEDPISEIIEQVDMEIEDDSLDEEVGQYQLIE